ncbi:MAG: hypothetical protein KY468_05210 [Armatimonadetes bacterium]|nr:hypothetical protein [Armatimonadota bacterium]
MSVLFSGRTGAAFRFHRSRHPGAKPSSCRPLILWASTILLMAGAIPARATSVVNPSTTVTPGAAGSNTATITATFSLRQGAQGGVTGGQQVTVTVNFWEDDLLFDDFLGSTTVTVTLPASASVTGPFTTPPVTIRTDWGSDFYAEVKAAASIGGASFVMAPAPAVPFAEERAGAESALASLTPPRELLQNPLLAQAYGQSMAFASIQFTGDKRFLVLQPDLPSFPQAGFRNHRYVAKLGFRGNPETITLGAFPTIVRGDTSALDASTDLTNEGRPVFEGFDVTDVQFSQIDRVIIAAQDLQGMSNDLEILSAPLGPFDCPTNFSPADVNRSGAVDIVDAITVLRTIVGLNVDLPAR